MSIEVTCDCGKGYRVSADKAGKRFKCRDCGSLVQVPDATTADDAEDDDDVELESGTEYVPAHHRAVAKARSAKKSARDQKRAAAWKRWLLIGGSVVAGVSLIAGGFVWANAVLQPEQKNLLWFTIGIPAYFVLGDQLRRYAIRNALQSCGETVQSISWRPFKNFFNLNGGWPPRLYFYEVRYLDRYGNARSHDVAFIRRRRMFGDDRPGGMVWDDDI